MRGLLAGLLVAALILVIALLVALAGSLGVSAIGLLLNKWFGLSQWQGTVVAFGVALSLGFVVYKFASQPALMPTSDYDWDEDWEEEEEEDEVEEPPIVPWRRSRPTQGELPADKPATGSPKRRK